MTMRSHFFAFILAFAISVPALGQDDAVAHFDQAAKLYKAGKMDAALAEFELARAASPKDPLIYNWIGFIKLIQEKYSEAVAPLEQAVKLNPKYAEAYTNLGNAYQNSRRPDDAVNAFKKAIDIDPKSANAHYN